MDLNKVMIIGRLTRDPELKSLPSGQSVATVGIATSRVWTDKEGQKQKQTEFHSVVFWRKLADIVGQYLRKGSQVYVEGRLQTRDWTGQDGVKKYRTEIVADNMIMLGGRGHEGTVSSASSAPVKEQPEDVIEEEVKVEDIPF